MAAVSVLGASHALSAHACIQIGWQARVSLEAECSQGAAEWLWDLQTTSLSFSAAGLRDVPGGLGMALGWASEAWALASSG